MDISHYRVPFKEHILLSDYDPGDTGEFKEKEDALEKLTANIEEMAELQDKLYAHDKYALLLIFQGMDAAGKDGAIKHVMSGLNPQGTQVFSFKQPSAEELDHDYLWRINKSLPERGRIGIFNRSHYEEVLVIRVHNALKKEKLPDELITDDIWEDRYSQIRNFEKYLYKNGVITVKFFLNISKAEQKKRFLRRLEDPARNWKFSSSDLAERKFWDEYQTAFSEAISSTARKYAPWYIIPADNKWFARFLISEVIVKHLRKLNISYPELSDDQKLKLAEYKDILLNEKE